MESPLVVRSLVERAAQECGPAFPGTPAGAMASLPSSWNLVSAQLPNLSQLQGSGDEGHVYSGDRIKIDMQPSQCLSLDGSIRLRKKSSIDLRGGTLEVFGQIGDKLASSSGQLTVSGRAVLRADELLLTSAIITSRCVISRGLN